MEIRLTKDEFDNSSYHIYDISVNNIRSVHLEVNPTGKTVWLQFNANDVGGAVYGWVGLDVAEAIALAILTCVKEGREK